MIYVCIPILICKYFLHMYIPLETFWLNFSEYIDEEGDPNNIPSWWSNYEECPLMNMESNLAKVYIYIYTKK